jgi:hypothetical protein
MTQDELMKTEITLKVTINDANLILSFLANGPHGQVREIVSKLENQTYSQIEAINKAAKEAEKGKEPEKSKEKTE